MKQLFEKYLSDELVHSSRYINTPNDFAKRSLLYVQETGYLKSLKSHLSQRSNLPSFLLIVILSGSGTITYRGEVYHAGAHDCILLDCMEVYTHQSDPVDPWELLWVHFYGNHAGDYYSYFTAQGTTVFHPADIQEYIRILQQLISFTKDQPRSYEILSSKLITDLLTLCITGQDPIDSTPTESITIKLDSVKEYLEKNYSDKLLLDDLAAHFYLSKYHLSREFKRSYGTTIVDYLTMRRITNAKELLRFTNQSIESIAIACGYPDASYFNKVFQKSENMTASVYRKKWRG